jgi:hypothetical protein
MFGIRSRKLGGWLLAGGVLATSVVGACADKKGAVMLAINTDMRAPKDVNAVSITISTNGAIKHSFIGRVTPQGEVLLPATLAIVEPDDASATIRVRVMAFQNQRPRVLRDVRTTVPTGGRTALLRIPLNFVNDGMVVGPSLPMGIVPDPFPGTGGETPPGGTSSSGGTSGSNGTSGGTSGTTADGGAPNGGTSGAVADGGASAGSNGGDGSAFGSTAGDFDFMAAFQPPCMPADGHIENQTIIDGECADNYVDPATLPDFDTAQLGDSTDVGTCFEIAKCFANAVPIGEVGNDQPVDGGTKAGGGDGGTTMAPDASAGSDCPPNEVLCPGPDGPPNCTNTLLDPNNCGMCGRKCDTASGLTCNSGTCGTKAFKDFHPADVGFDSTTCVVKLNGADPARLNLAIVTPDTGECVSPGNCYVPIDHGDGGWQEQNGVVQLPKFICKLVNGKNLHLVISPDVCAAKEEKNPICTPKVGEAISDSGTTDHPDATANDGGFGDGGGPNSTFYIPEDGATSVVINGSTLRYASGSHVGQVDVRTPGAVPMPLPGVPPINVPWRFSLDGTAAANGSNGGFAFEGAGTATLVTVAAGTIDVASGGGGFFWAVGGQGIAQGGVWGGPAGSQPQQLNLVPFNGDPAPSNVTALSFEPTNSVLVVGELDGTIRLCSSTQCSQATSIGSRIDALVGKPNDPKNGYALTTNGVYKSIVVDAVTGQISTAPLGSGETAGVQNASGYYARGLAASPQCVVYSTAGGINWVVDSVGGPQGTLAVPTKAPILGVAIGPEPGNGFSAVYYTVFAPASQGGGIYRAELPSICGGSLPFGAGTDAGVPACGPGNCPTGCCTGAGQCLDFGKGQQSNTACGQMGGLCQDCTPMGVSCAPAPNGGFCGG